MPRFMGFGQLTSPAYFAAATLVAIQVAIGLLFKAVQVKGTCVLPFNQVLWNTNQGNSYAFSTSSSIAISEFLKFGISMALFSRTCLTRFRDRKSGYQLLEDNNTLLHNYVDTRVSEEAEDIDDSRLNKVPSLNDEIYLEALFTSTQSHKCRDRSFLSFFLSSCVQEVSSKHILGYGHLALLYALINNTVGE